MQYTSEQVLSLSPNTGNATRGKKLANTAKWPLLGANDSGIWGEAKGSGAKPYLTAIDFNGPAFKCSCPSREFPCKHGIGLFLLYVNEIDAFTELNMPEWMEEWIAKRSTKEETKTKIEKTPVDEAKLADSKAKRYAKRMENMKAGLLSLESWLEDIIEQGFGSLDPSNSEMWINKAKELTNAQCAGMGTRLQNIPTLLRKANWVENLLIEMGGLNVLIQAFKQLDQLPELLQQDVLNQLGVNTAKEDLQTLETIEDHWLVISNITKSERELAERKIWLYGKETQKYAMLLDFSYGGKPFDFMVPNGKTIEATIIYYPSSVPQRAIIKGEVKTVTDTVHINYFNAFDEVALKFVEEKSKNPFLREIPFSLSDIVLFLENKKIIIQDVTGNKQKINIHEDKLMLVLSITLGHPFGIFGTYSKEGIAVESIIFDNKIVIL